MNQLNLNYSFKLDFISDEAYKVLRTNLELSGKDVKVVALTSCIPNEGKSTVTLNLAMSLSQEGKKVLFIDGDLRKSVLFNRLKPGKVEKGLTHYLSGMNSLEEVVYKTNISGFDIIFTGPTPPDPVKLFGGSYYQKLIQTMRKSYDYIIIDTPPLGSVIDSAVIAKECDGTILVIQSNKISYKFARKVKEQLEKSGCTIIGTVLNQVKVKKGIYYNKYYNKKYMNYYKNSDYSNGEFEDNLLID